jgi:VWFA-related protein
LSDYPADSAEEDIVNHLIRAGAANVTIIAATLCWSPAGAGALQDTALQSQDQTTVIKHDVDLVSVYFSVRDARKRLVPYLTQEQFRVVEDGREQNIRFFAHHSDVPLNVGILLDTGTSMGRTLGIEADASSLFLERVVRKSDLAFIVSYAAHADTLQSPTADVALLKEQVRTIRSYATAYQVDREPRPMIVPPLGIPGGGMPPPLPNNLRREAHLYDAVRMSTFRYLKREMGRKALLIVALSDDSRSESTLEDALDALQQSDVIAYVFQIYDGAHDNCDVNHIFTEGKLRKLAEETGGRMIEVRGMDKLQSAFDEISEELHNQYSLGYYPANNRWDGKYRKIHIETRDHGYRVFARKGYYAVPPSQR